MKSLLLSVVETSFSKTQLIFYLNITHLEATFKV
uniref:Uncharacterized protein n=1 Tax=Podoviridae sp. ct8Lf7 TaxID=2827723 RepID=A0A8S5S0P6_9CAUD|nr:MAG TPA: hypothetical protein [Podoviridae sp. ct8Lf7]